MTSKARSSITFLSFSRFLPNFPSGLHFIEVGEWVCPKMDFGARPLGNPKPILYQFISFLSQIINSIRHIVI